MVSISGEDRQLLKQVVSQVFPGETLEDAVRLGGLTNRTYAVALANDHYVIRLPGEGTEELINRSDEKISNELADELGLDAKLMYFNAETGVKVSAYLQDAVTMRPESMREERAIHDAAELLNVLHNSGRDTGVQFDVFDMALRYEGICKENNVFLYADYPEVRAAVMAIREKAASLGISKVPCHNDPLCENWVRSHNRMYLVDWEYAGMNDPFWDLADLSLEAGFSPAMDDLLLSTYLKRKPDEIIFYRVVANKIFVDFLWSLWGKARVPFDGNDMEEYAYDRYRRLKENLSIEKALA